MVYTIRTEKRGYTRSGMYMDDLKKLSRLERDFEAELSPYIDFEIIKKLK